MRNRGDVPADELFFYQYFAKQRQDERRFGRHARRPATAAGVGDDDETSEKDDDEEEAEISKLLLGQLGGDDQPVDIDEDNDEEEEEEEEEEMKRESEDTDAGVDAAAASAGSDDDAPSAAESDQGVASAAAAASADGDAKAVEEPAKRREHRCASAMAPSARRPMRPADALAAAGLPCLHRPRSMRICWRTRTPMSASGPASCGRGGANVAHPERASVHAPSRSGRIARAVAATAAAAVVAKQPPRSAPRYSGRCK